MELLQLKYFCDAAETQNFSKTAQKYSVPASNISQSIHRLETELGKKLFDRGVNRISINESGKIFYKEVRKALNALDGAKAALREAEGDINGAIRLCICTSRRIVTGAIAKFKAMYPAVSFFINHSLTAGTQDFDLIISDEYVSSASVSKKLLLSEDIVLALRKSHPLARLEAIGISDLRDERFICMPERSGLYKITNAICADAGFAADIVIQSDDPYYVREYIELGLGIAFIPSISWKGMFSDNIVLRSVGEYKRKTYAFWQNEKYMTKSTRAFLELLVSEYESCI